MQTTARPTLTDLLFEKANVGLCLVAPDGTVIRANSEWLRSTGCSAEQVIGEDIADLFPKTRGMALAMHARARAGHRVEIPRHAQTVNGRETWWEGSIEPVQMEGGTGLLVTARDVSSGSEPSEHETEQTYRAVFQHSADAIFVTRHDGTILDANPAACRSLGMTVEEIRQRGRSGVMVQDERLTAALAERDRQGFARAELTMQRKDGTTFPVEMVSAIVDAARPDWTAFVTARDITQRRRADEALRESEERLRLAIEAASVGIWDFDPATQVITFDIKRDATFGLPKCFKYPYSDFLGDLNSEDRQRVNEAVQRALDPTGDGRYQAEYRWRRPDGVELWVAATGQTSFADVDGRRTAVRMLGTVVEVTERKRGEEALRATEERFRALVLASSDVVYRMSPDWTEMWHLGGGDFIADADAPTTSWIQKYIPPDEQARVMAAIEDAVRNRGTFELEHRVVRADGTFWWTFSRAIPLLDAGGVISEWCGMASDVTARKGAEEALRESESFYRQTLESIPGMVFTTRPDGYCDFQSQQWVEYTGVPMTEHLGDGWNKLLHPEDRALAFERWQSAVQGTAPYDLEYRVRRRDGEYEWFRVIGRPIRDDAGEIVRWFGVAMNIEMLKRAEGGLRDSERRWQQLADSMPQIIWASRPDGCLDYYNRRWYELTGADTDAHGDQSWLPILHPDDRQRCLDIWYESVRTGRPYQIEYRFKFPSSGEYRWHLGRALPVRDDDGSIVRWFGTCTDIHDQKVAEESLREADRRKDEFLGMLSHELRNPLAPIRNSTYILRHGAPGSEQARRAQGVIERQVEHLTNLVDDLLDVTRIARGKIELRRARVDLRDVTRRTSEDFHSVMEDRGVVFRTVVPEAKLWADADATRIAQIIGNLLHNAAKFTQRGGDVTLSLAEHGSEAEIAVRDTGAGIDAALLPRIFEPFVQGERTLARSGGGLGLGLALVKGIAELHGGTVRAASAGTGRGAEFIVRFPLVEGTAMQDAASARVHRVNGGRRVLVVDDNADAAESLADLVGMLGHAVEVAYDGPSAIERARACPPDVVLCDIGLPGISGYEVARALRDGGNGMQLFAVSGYAQPEDVKKAIEAGFDGHLAKPLNIEDLERLLA